MNSNSTDRSIPTHAKALILLVSYAFYPANEIGARRTTALAKYLVTQGYRVAVVSSFGGLDVTMGSQILPGITAIPVPPPPKTLIKSIVALKKCLTKLFGRSSAPSPSTTSKNFPTNVIPKGTFKNIFFRILCFVDEYKRWSWRASRATIDVARQHTPVVIISSGPPHTALLAGTLAARTLHIPHIADLRDPWTDCVTANPNRRLDYLLQRPLEKWVIRSAACITSAGAMVAEQLAKRFSDSQGKVHLVRNGYDGDCTNVPQNPERTLSILFAGELYLGRDPFPILEALERLLQRSDVDATRIKVTFMGRVDHYDGRSLSDWLVGTRLSQSMTLVSHSPAEVVKQAAMDATVLLNLAQRQPYSVPAKTYEHLTLGREILIFCENDSETACLVKGIKGINQVDPTEPLQLDRVLLELYRRHAVEGRIISPSADEIHNFSRATANREFLRLIKDTLNISHNVRHMA